MKYVARPTRMFGTIVPGIYYSVDEIQRLQDSLRRKATLIDAAATTCAALDQPTLTSWRLQGYVPAMAYAGQDIPIAVNLPGLTSMYVQGKEYEQTLDSLADKLRADGCPIESLREPNPYDGAIKVAKWVGGGAVVLLGLVAVIKIADVIDDAERIV